jgi:hypothetical protein
MASAYADTRIHSRTRIVNAAKRRSGRHRCHARREASRGPGHDNPNRRYQRTRTASFHDRGAEPGVCQPAPIRERPSTAIRSGSRPRRVGSSMPL